MEVLYAAVVLIVVFALVAAGRIWQWSIQANERLRKLEEVAVEQAVKAQPAKRLDNTVSQNAAFEDALAVVMRVLMEEDAQAEYRQAWMRKLQSILQTARTGPHAYPVDQPSGNGINKRRVTYSETVERLSR